MHAGSPPGLGKDSTSLPINALIVLLVALVYIGQVDALRVAGVMIFANLARLALYACKQRAA